MNDSEQPDKSSFSSSAGNDSELSEILYQYFVDEFAITGQKWLPNKKLVDSMKTDIHATKAIAAIKAYAATQAELAAVEARITVFKDVLDNYRHQWFKKYIIDLYEEDLKRVAALRSNKPTPPISTAQGQHQPYYDPIADIMPTPPQAGEEL